MDTRVPLAVSTCLPLYTLYLCFATVYSVRITYQQVGKFAQGQNRLQEANTDKSQYSLDKTGTGEGQCSRTLMDFNNLYRM